MPQDSLKLEMKSIQKRPAFVKVIAASLLTSAQITSQLNVATASPLKAAAVKFKPVEFSDVDSLTYKSVSIKVNGKDKKLASIDPITIRFQSKAITAKAGCNTLAGSAKLSKGILQVRAIASTRMACSNALMKQDTWLTKILTSKPKLTLLVNSVSSKSSSNTKIKPYLTMTSGSTEIKMEIYETYGYADTPLGDENSEATAKAICKKLVLEKASESDAQFAAEQNALIFRVASRDGVDLAVTMDYRVNRINVKVVRKIVTECTQG